MAPYKFYISKAPWWPDIYTDSLQFQCTELSAWMKYIVINSFSNQVLICIGTYRKVANTPSRLVYRICVYSVEYGNETLAAFNIFLSTNVALKWMKKAMLYVYWRTRIDIMARPKYLFSQPMPHSDEWISGIAECLWYAEDEYNGKAK